MLNVGTARAGGGSTEQGRDGKQVSLGAKDVVDCVTVDVIIDVKQLTKQTAHTMTMVTVNLYITIVMKSLMR